MSQSRKTPLSRRHFLQGMAMASSGVALAACQTPATPEAPTAVPDSPTSAPESPTAVPDAPTEAPPALQGGKVTVMYSTGDMSEESRAEFLADNPDVQIEFVEEDRTRLFAMIAAGAAPDVIRFIAPAIPEFVARDLLLDLTPYFQSSQLLKIDDLADANKSYWAEDAFTIGSGAMYGMCKDFSPELQSYVNTAACEEAGVAVPDDATPMTWGQLAEFATQLKKKEGDRMLRFGFAYPNIEAQTQIAITQAGGNLWGPEYQTINMDDTTKEVIRWFFDVNKNELVPNSLNPEPEWFGPDFAKGLIGLVQVGYWFTPMAEGEELKGKVISVPGAMWEGGTRFSPVYWGTGAVIYKNSPVPDAAWRLFEWYMGGKPSVDRASSGWGVPALKSQFALIPEESDYQKQAKKVLMDEINFMLPPLAANPYGGFNQIFASGWGEHIDSALKDEIDFDTFISKVEETANQLIQDGIDRLGV